MQHRRDAQPDGVVSGEPSWANPVMNDDTNQQAILVPSLKHVPSSETECGASWIGLTVGLASTWGKPIRVELVRIYVHLRIM